VLAEPPGDVADVPRRAHAELAPLLEGELVHRCDDLRRESHVRGARGRGGLPQPLRAHRTGGRQRLVHAAHAEHESRSTSTPSTPATTEWERPLVDSTFTLALVTGLSVADVSERGVNLGWREVRLPAPVFAGDTIRAETEVLEKRESKSRPGFGIVTVRTRGLNQRDEVVIEFERSIMLPL
jgi:acyl dehydratase